MRNKYVTTQVLLACRHKQMGEEQDIHAMILESIAERKIAIEEWNRSFSANIKEVKKDIHTQLKETIARHKQTMKQSARI